MLVTERPGRLRVIGADGAVGPPLAGVPEVVSAGQGGLLDIQIALDFSATHEVYLCLASEAADCVLTRPVRGRLPTGEDRTDGVETLLDASSGQMGGRGHYGCRIAFGGGGNLYLATGDRQRVKQRAQRRDDLAGKVLRLERDGRPAAGNPFAGRPDARPEIWTLGHRSPQGLQGNPATGSLWEVEMGPRGGGEVDVLRPGGNYGWPAVGRGIDYDGSRIHEAVSRSDMVDPVRWWAPVISPSGAAFYDGTRFPGWRGSLLLARLNPPGLTRLSIEGDRVTGRSSCCAAVRACATSCRDPMACSTCSPMRTPAGFYDWSPIPDLTAPVVQFRSVLAGSNGMLGSSGSRSGLCAAPTPNPAEQRLCFSY